MSVGDDELRIVASQSIGSSNPTQSTPVVLHWRWYYHIPALALWTLVFLTLVVPKANRHRQAWLILVPLGLVLLVWRMPLTLLSAPDATVESLGFYIVSGTMAWSLVWLLGNRLACRSRKASFFLIVGTTLAVGLLSYYCHFGDADNLLSSIVAYGMPGVTLTLAMMLSSWACGEKCSPARFCVWLLLWTGALSLAMLVSYAAISLIALAVAHPSYQFLAHFAVLLISVVIASVFLTGIVYVLNLPFLILVFKCPFYRERFENLFHVKLNGEPTS